MEQFEFRYLPPATITVAVLLLLPFVAPDISSDRTALIAFHAAVGKPLLRWDLTASSPCNWSGITCSGDGSSVIEIRLPARGLSGKLPVTAFAKMTRLRFISLRHNSLSGTLPPGIFAAAASLRGLSLLHNSFSGNLPDSLFSLKTLIHLNLGHNSFSGPVTTSFNNLTRLQSLELNENHFSGPIPDLQLPELSKFNVSNNHLSGSVPAALAGFPATSFLGNSLCGFPSSPCTKVSNNVSDIHRNPNPIYHAMIVGGIIGGTLAGFLIVASIIFCICRKLWKKKPSLVDHKCKGMIRSHPCIEPCIGEKGEGNGSGIDSRTWDKRECNVINVERNSITFCGKVEYVFRLEELLGASAEILGKGCHGLTYKAMVRMGPAMVVKRIRDVKIGAMEFKERVEKLGRLVYGNLLPLKAYFCNGTESLLVFEYMPLGSLSKLLHEEKRINWTPLSWKSRLLIMRGAARGILYIHLQGSNSTHGNINSSNILLSASHEALVSDFGLNQLGGAITTPINTNNSYRAPEIAAPQESSQKADVYSFGIVLLELLTGKVCSPECRKQIDDSNSFNTEDLEYLMLDTELSCDDSVEDSVIQIFKLALGCTVQNPDERPSMFQVSGEIEQIWDRVGDR